MLLRKKFHELFQRIVKSKVDFGEIYGFVYIYVYVYFIKIK